MIIVSMIVVLDNIRSALNVGSIIRTCDAFGIREVYLCGITPGADNFKVLKTSLGAEKSIVYTNPRNTFDAIQNLKKRGYQIISLEINKSSTDISSYIPKRKNVVLVLGNEVSGISEDVLDLSDEIIMIPMKGKKESLNVSVAFGIAAYCLTRQ
jgi:23S rRNA (guanosine2251-2'-O)-methyltransferase